MKKILVWFFRAVGVSFAPFLFLGGKIIHYIDDTWGDIGVYVLFATLQMVYWVLIIDAIFIREIIK